MIPRISKARVLTIRGGKASFVQAITIQWLGFVAEFSVGRAGL